LKVRFLPRSPFIINHLQGFQKRLTAAESVGLALPRMAISFHIRKIGLRLSEGVP
jgi:hypothetical protein